MAQSVKLRNRQLKKRTQALENKVHGIKQLGVDVVLVLKFPGKESGYSYVSSEEFLDRIMQIRSHAKTVNKLPGDVEKDRLKSTPSRIVRKEGWEANKITITPDQRNSHDKNREFFPKPPTLECMTSTTSVNDAIIRDRM